MSYIKVKNLLDIDVKREEVEEVAQRFEELKPFKIVENRLKWEKLRDRVLEEIQEKPRPYLYKIANEIMSSYDKALRETERITINILNISNRVFTIKVKDEGEKKILLEDDGMKIIDGEVSKDGQD